MTDSPLTRVLTAHRCFDLESHDCGDGEHWQALCACGPLGIWSPRANGAYADWIAHVVSLVTAETQAELTQQFAGYSYEIRGHETLWPVPYSGAMVESAEETR